LLAARFVQSVFARLMPQAKIGKKHFDLGGAVALTPIKTYG
jgi:hypothetical protein